MIVVVFLSLQNWRATLIPTIAVPISLIGTFGFMLIFGFSLNILTLLGLVLAIGLVVDDAIVVVENVERIMEEEHLSPYEATKKAMDGLTGAHGRTDWSFDCHFHGAGSRIRAGKFLVGHYRAIISPVQYHHCRIGFALYCGGIDLEFCARTTLTNLKTVCSAPLINGWK